MVGFLTSVITAASVLVASQQALANPSALLIARQLGGVDPGDIPTQCIQAQCNSFISDVENCASAVSSGTGTAVDVAACYCKSTTSDDLKSCMQCVVQLDSSTFNQTYVDQSIQSYQENCAALGHPVSGASDSSSSGSSSGSSSSSGASGGGASSAGSNSGGSGSTTQTSTSGSPTGIITKNDAQSAMNMGIAGLVALTLSVFTLV